MPQEPRALRSLFLAIDEGRKTELREAILKFWNLPSLEAFIQGGASCLCFSRLIVATGDTRSTSKENDIAVVPNKRRRPQRRSSKPHCWSALEEAL
jgi:hypothetical protein